MMVMEEWLVVGRTSLGRARARLSARLTSRALSGVYKGSSSLSTFIAANSRLMVLDDCGGTTRRLALTCAWSWARFRGCMGAF